MATALPLVTHEVFVPQLYSAAGDDAMFRSQCQAIHDCFYQLGWRQTTDTGQADLTTLSRPSTAEYPGTAYEIWSTQDGAALDVDVPIYVKVQYGMGSGSIFGVHVSVGTATNGAGEIDSAAGHHIAAPYVAPILRKANTISDVGYGGGYFRATGNAGCITLSVYARGGGSETTGGVFYLERCLNADGSANSLGAHYYTFGTSLVTFTNATTKRYAVMLFHQQIGMPTASTSFGPCYCGDTTSVTPIVTSSSLVNNIMAVFPVFTGYWGGIGGLSRIACGVNSYDCPVNTKFATTWYGQPAEFAAIGIGKAVDPSYYTPWSSMSQSSWCRPAMLIVPEV